MDTMTNTQTNRSPLDVVKAELQPIWDRRQAAEDAGEELTREEDDALVEQREAICAKHGWTSDEVVDALWEAELERQFGGAEALAAARAQAGDDGELDE
jgi:hypothetical protein